MRHFSFSRFSRYLIRQMLPIFFAAVCFHADAFADAAAIFAIDAAITPPFTPADYFHYFSAFADYATADFTIAVSLRHGYCCHIIDTPGTQRQMRALP
jgi:hypothetical protein